MKILKKVSLSILTISILFGGCASKGYIPQDENLKDVSTLGNKNDKEFEKIKEIVEETKPLSEQNIKKREIDRRNISLNNESISTILKKLERINQAHYILQGKNVLLENSTFKIKSLEDLKYYVRSTTDYYIKEEKKYNFKNEKDNLTIIKVIQKEEKTVFNEKKVVYNKKQMNPFEMLQNISIDTHYTIISPDKIIKLLNRDSNTQFYGDTYNKFFEYLRVRFNIFLTLDHQKKQIKLEEYQMRRIQLDIPTLSIDTKMNTNSIQGSEGLTLTGASTLTSENKINVLEELTATLNLIINQNKTDEGSNSSFKIDKTTGIVSLIGKPSDLESMIKAVKNFNDELKTKILISMKVYEVELKKSFTHGIDWGLFSKNFTKSGINIGKLNPTESDPFLGAGTNGTFLTFNYASLSGKTMFTSLIQALQNYGKITSTRAFSLMTLNNIPITQSISQAFQYLAKVNINIENNNDDTTTRTVSPDIASASEGVNIYALPRFNKITNKITLQIQPTVVKLVDLEKIVFGDVSKGEWIQVPHYMSRTLGSNVTIEDGDSMLIAGIIFDDVDSKYAGFSPNPGAENEPYDYLTGTRDAKKSRKELVIVLTVTKL